MNNRDMNASRHYDDITKYMFWTNRMKNRGRIDPAFHKIMNVPEAWKRDNRKELPSNYLHDLILSVVQVPDTPMVLDAGCGFGGTVFWFQKKHPGTYHGITTSRVQVGYAKRLAEAYGVGEDCRFFAESYDSPRQSKYDIAIAIESLLHSKDIGATIKNLSRCLKPRGKLIIVEDMLVREDQPAGADFRYLMKEWAIQRFPSHELYRLEIAKNGLHVLVDRDLTQQVSLMSKQALNLVKRVGNLCSRVSIGLIPKIGRFHVAQANLHLLYHGGFLEYRLLVAEREDWR